MEFSQFSISIGDVDGKLDSTTNNHQTHISLCLDAGIMTHMIHPNKIFACKWVSNG